MKITFLGAAEMVTGSCYLCEVDETKLLVDFGMFQGGSAADDLNFNDFTFHPAEIDYLILTHAHIDHSGRIPQLVRRGFQGRIITTAATKDLCSIMLPDSGFIQETETEWINKKRLRAGKSLVEPLYTSEDAHDALKYFEGIEYDEIITIHENVSLRLRNAGHILGSSILEMWVKENDKEIKIVFSGDLGSKNSPLLDHPTMIDEADFVIMESTYGNRLHPNSRNKALQLLEIILETVKKKGNIVIPSFAVERTQEILYELNTLKEAKESKLKDIPVFVDSPLAINATKIFERNKTYFNDDTIKLFESGDNPFDFPNLIFTETSEESKAINFEKRSCIIISASGMCDAGRIKHHLKHNLWRSECSVVFVGYQAKESLGRRIVDGAKSVKLFGEEINVQSSIYSIEGFSGHADQKGLLEWVSGFKKKPSKIFLTHGEDEALTELSRLITKNFGIANEIPKLGQTIELSPCKESSVVKERSFASVASIQTNIDHLKNDFEALLEQLQEAASAGEYVKTDELYYLIDELQSTVKDVKNKVK
ncbi:MAG: fold hydrolase [Clostridia bacterium]|jgi:metallo-beta-lactamase family protein|nr:fold hydrolase [Clostridia bacterium]